MDVARYSRAGLDSQRHSAEGGAADGGRAGRPGGLRRAPHGRCAIGAVGALGDAWKGWDWENFSREEDGK